MSIKRFHFGQFKFRNIHNLKLTILIKDNKENFFKS